MTEPPNIPFGKLDEYRYFASGDDDRIAFRLFPFEVPERSVKIELDTMLCEWMRDNPSYPWTLVSRNNEDLIDEMFFRFQTEQDAMLFKLRF
jgi:hypothetical protein